MPFELKDVECIRSTGKAILVTGGDIDEVAGEETWVPQSVVHEDSEIWKEGQEGTLVIASWFARKQGWE